MRLIRMRNRSLKPRIRIWIHGGRLYVRVWTREWILQWKDREETSR